MCWGSPPRRPLTTGVTLLDPVFLGFPTQWPVRPYRQCDSLRTTRTAQNFGGGICRYDVSFKHNFLFPRRDAFFSRKLRPKFPPRFRCPLLPRPFFFHMGCYGRIPSLIFCDSRRLYSHVQKGREGEQGLRLGSRELFGGKEREERRGGACARGPFATTPSSFNGMEVTKLFRKIVPILSFRRFQNQLSKLAADSL